MESDRSRLVLVYLAIGVATAWLMQFLWSVLSQAGTFVVMLLVAWILTVVALGPVRLLRRLRIPRALAAGFVYLVVLGVVGVGLFFVLPPLFGQVGQAAESLTQQVGAIPQDLSNLQAQLVRLGVPEDFVRSAITNASQQLVAVVQELASGAITATGAVAGGVVSAAVTLVLSFYLLLGWDTGVQRLSASLPADWSARLERGVRASELTFGAWLGGQFVASVIWGAVVVIAYAVAGLEFGLLVAVLTGVLLFIPFIGMIAGIALPIGMAAAVRIDLAIWVGVTVTVASVVIENVIKPRVMGAAIGVNPIVILSSVILGGIAAGFWGVLFGIPIGALLWTFLRWAGSEFLHAQQRAADAALAPAAAPPPAAPPLPDAPALAANPRPPPASDGAAP